MGNTTDENLYELCSEVYKRFPKWDGGKQFAYDLTYADKWLRYIGDFPHDTREWRLESMVPLYDSDYLLEKLPKSIENNYRPTLMPALLTKWRAAYDDDDGLVWKSFYADSPLKALLKLVIALDDAGVKLEAR